MKKLLIICFLALPIISFCQFDLKLEYFKSDKNSLVWQTAYERGKDTFYLYQSQSELNWDQVAVVYSKENEIGSYYTYEPKIEKTTYFKLVWGGGVSYAVISVLPMQKETYFNILGQKTNQGWLIH